MESTAGYFLSFAAHKIRRVEEAKKLAKVTVVKSQGKSSLEKKKLYLSLILLEEIPLRKGISKWGNG